MAERYFHDGETVRMAEGWFALRRSDPAYARVNSLPGTLRKYAKDHGIAVLWRADDAAVTVEYVAGKFTTRTTPKADWDWPGKGS